MKVRETKIIEKLIHYCYENNLRYAVEVPFFLSKIDLVSLDQRNNEVIAIEAKVSNWHRAIQQATSYTLCADRVYLALWHEFAHRVDIRLLERYGIGLLSVDGKVEILQHAQKSQGFNKELMKKIKNFVYYNN